MSASQDESVVYIYTTSIRLSNGRVIYAHEYGLKSFRIAVKSRK